MIEVRTSAVGGAVYDFANDRVSHSNTYLWPVAARILGTLPNRDKRIFEIGCGNGATAVTLARHGYIVVGIDPSPSGIKIAQQQLTNGQFYVRSIEDDLAKEFGRFPVVISFEVVSHVLRPRLFAVRVFELLEPGGIAIISAPYHGYAKNLALSIFNRWDLHLDPFWQGGQIRFFSRRSYLRLWHEAGFKEVKILRVGRLPILAKSMVAVVSKPSHS